MKKLFLHIGTGKTGTSSIQNFLYANRAELCEKYGVLYPKTGLVDSSHFGEMIYAHYSLPGWITDGREAELDQLKQEIHQSPCKVAILSCENFYHNLKPENLGFLKQKFSEFEVHVVCYVRRQDSYMVSAWKQQVKVGAMRVPFEKFLDRHTDSKFLEEVHGNYYRMLLPWAATFGKNRLHIRIFDPVTWPGRDLLADFVQALGLASEISKMPNSEVSNVAMPSELMRLLCKINSLKLVDASQQEALLGWLRSSRDFGDPPLLSYSERCAILANYEASNQQLFRELIGRTVHPCFTVAAVVKPKEPEVPPARKRVPLEDLAVRTLIAAWAGRPKPADGAAAEKVPQQPAGGVTWQDQLAQHLAAASREEQLAFKAFVDFVVQSKLPANPQREKPWPPKVEEPLGFSLNTRPGDVVKFILECQAKKKAASIIRLGDGESAVIGYPEFTPRKEFQHFVKLFFGVNSLDEEQQKQFVELVRKSVSAADIIGVVGGEAVTRFTVVRFFMQHFGLAKPDVCISLLSLHRNLQENGLYTKLLTGQPELGLITCRDVEEQLKSTFGVPKITTYKIPEEAGHAARGAVVARHYPDRFEELKKTLVVPYPGALFLVGAGPLGKVYCQLIKEKGGIGLDVGSMFDAWAGLATRKFMKTEVGQVKSTYRLG